MRIFLSFSGARSLAMATELHDWLPRVLPGARPWFSQNGVPAGSQWLEGIGRAIDNSEFGILCLTRENLHQPWIHFEAGALAKSPTMGRSAVCPFLLDVGPEQLTDEPLAQFQAKRATRDGAFDLVKAIHDRMPQPEPVLARLQETFDSCWDRLASRLEVIREEPSKEGLSPRERAVEALAQDAQIILMEDFVQAESCLGTGDTALLFSNDLTYDRCFFTDVIADNLRRGVSYLYLLNKNDAEAGRNWELFLGSLTERGVPDLPKCRRIDTAPLFWTTAIYEFHDPAREVEAISILEHRFESRACVRLSPIIARQMRKRFLECWEVADPS